MSNTIVFSKNRENTPLSNRPLGNGACFFVQAQAQERKGLSAQKPIRCTVYIWALAHSLALAVYIWQIDTFSGASAHTQAQAQHPLLVDMVGSAHHAKRDPDSSLITCKASQQLNFSHYQLTIRQSHHAKKYAWIYRFFFKKISRI